MNKEENNSYRAETDGFHGELFLPPKDKYPGKVLICFSGSYGKFELTRTLARVFQSHGLTTRAFAYVIEVGLPKQFSSIPVDFFGGGSKTAARYEI